MNFEEFAAKPLLAAAGIAVPGSSLANNPADAAQACETLGPCVIKAQVPIGKRGKAGGILAADEADAAENAAQRILGMDIGGYTVEKVLVEQQANIKHEFYAAVLNDPGSKGPLIMFSDMGGMDIEEIAENQPQHLISIPVDIKTGPDSATISNALEPLLSANKDIAALGLTTIANDLAQLLCKLYTVYDDNDAELLEINPLAIVDNNQLLALDCKFVMDDSALVRQSELAKNGTPEKLTGRELDASKLDLKYIDLEGNVGVLANGAGLTMTTMDVVTHYGGQPANFLEIGGEAYTKATDALKLMLGNDSIKSLVVNFCGAFARTDVMTDGVIKAWLELQPDIPVFFSIHGTGSEEARQLLKDKLGLTSHETMDDAIKAAVAAAGAKK